MTLTEHSHMAGAVDDSIINIVQGGIGIISIKRAFLNSGHFRLQTITARFASSEFAAAAKNSSQ